MKIFSGSSNKPLTEKIAKELDINLSPLEIHIFPDGERRIRVLDNVVDQGAVIVQSCSTPADTNYMELFFIADALKRSGAKLVTAVISYLGYQRQDHVFRSGEAVSLQVIAETLEAVGINKIIVVDLHSIKIKEVIHIPVIHLSALEIFAEKIKKESWIEDAVLVSPDMGGIRRVKILSEMLNYLPVITINKDRNLQTGEISIKGYKGKIAKRAIIVDDMISTGGTIVKAAELLKQKGAKEIFVFVTHAVFSSDAPKILQSSKVKFFFVTDTINIPKDRHFAKLKILSVGKLIAQNLK